MKEFPTSLHGNVGYISAKHAYYLFACLYEKYRLIDSYTLNKWEQRRRDKALETLNKVLTGLAHNF